MPFSMGPMVAAAVTMYIIWTAIPFFAVIYEVADSFGGLMYAQDHRYILEVDHQTQRQLSSSNNQRGPAVTKNIGS